MSMTDNEGQGLSPTGQALDPLLVGAPPIVQTMDTSYDYNPEPRPASDPRFAPSGWSPKNRYDQYVYTGPGLVNSNGQVTMLDDSGQPRYYTQNDATAYYFNLPTAQKALLLETMARKGYSTGTPERDQNAIWDLMRMSNMLGRTVDVTLQKLDRIAGDKAERVAAPRYRVSSSADIRAVAKETAKRILGRDFTEDEAARFVASYQQAELAPQQSTATVTESVASVDVAAEQFAQKIAPTEANGIRYVGAVDTLMKSIGRI